MKKKKKQTILPVVTTKIGSAICRIMVMRPIRFFINGPTKKLCIEAVNDADAVLQEKKAAR